MAKFPDLTGDGEVTQADILKGRGVYKKGGSVKNDHGHKPMAKMSHGGHYCWGGKVMKKREGGDVKKDDIELEEMPSGAKQYIRGKNRSEKDETVAKYTRQTIDEMEPGSKDFDKQFKKADKLVDAREDNLDAYDKELGMKRGGMAKGGNWIQSAIKKPGALKKSLGVPMGEKIPAGKLKTASKAPGKMGQRARLAMTLKGMK